jgi:O-antigen ligase
MKRKRLTWFFALLLVMPPTTRYIPFGVDIGGILFNLPRISMLACAVVAAYTLVYRPQLRLSYSDIGVVSLLLLLILSIAWSVAPEESVRRATDLLFYIIYFVSIVVYFNRESAFKLFVAVLPIPAAAMVSYSVLNLIYSAPGWRLVDLISRNGVSRDMVATLPILFFGAYGRGRVHASVRLLLAGMMVLFVPLSGSRSGLVALAVTLVLIILVWGNRVKRLSLAPLALMSAVSIVVFVAGVGVAFITGVLPERILRIPLISGGISPETLGRSRYQVRLAELGTIQSHPITGIGYGAFFQYSAEQFGIGNFRAHSLITRVWMGAGLPGILLLLFSGGLIIRNYIRQVITSRSDETLWLFGCLIGLIATTLTGMFNIVIIQPLFYLLIGVGSSAVIVNKG